jgi:hypothetical protein
MLRLFKPEVFQGNLRKKNYFEGWYFKQVSSDLNNVYSFIPGISLTKKDKMAFIQVINGITGKTNFIRYPISDFEFDKKEFFVKIANSVFTRDHIQLDISDDSIMIRGELHYKNIVSYPGTFLSPGIMGWYTFVPLMECYHGVVSIDHSIEGQLDINGQEIDFNGGKGYIEKDWGRSFPECWIWAQSNSFQKSDQSVFASIAKIPWLGNYFIGFIAFVYIDGELILFNTYNKSKISQVKRQENHLVIAMQNKTHKLKLDISVKNSGDLLAPVRGSLNRMIKESINSEMRFELLDIKTGLVKTGYSPRSGLEIIEGIFDYF